MYPMDFEEFLEATGDTMTWDAIKNAFDSGRSLGDAVHRQIMRKFRLYMLVGGLPQAVATYIERNNLKDVDRIKRDIIELYLEDFSKIDSTGFAANLFKLIPAELSRNTSRFNLGKVDKTGRLESRQKVLADMLDSYTINIAYHSDDPNVGLGITANPDCFKVFTLDTGIFVTLAFMDKDYTDNIIYSKFLSDKLSVNLGYIFENVVSQELVSSGNKLYYHTMDSDTSNHLYEVDFILSKENKICPIEVKSASYRTHTSLDFFIKKYSARIGEKYVIHTKDFKKEGGITYLPVYMTALL